jgi:hypothetical protein
MSRSVNSIRFPELVRRIRDRRFDVVMVIDIHPIVDFENVRSEMVCVEVSSHACGEKLFLSIVVAPPDTSAPRLNRHGAEWR